MNTLKPKNMKAEIKRFTKLEKKVIKNIQDNKTESTNTIEESIESGKIRASFNFFLNK